MKSKPNPLPTPVPEVLGSKFAPSGVFTASNHRLFPEAVRVKEPKGVGSKNFLGKL